MNILPVTSYPYVSLSANYPHDEFISFNPYFQQYNNGFYLFDNKIFNSIIDISFNKYTGFYLSDKFKNKEIIKNSAIRKKEVINNSFVNLFMFSTLKYVTVRDDDYLYSDAFTLKESDRFQAIVEGDKIYFIYNKISYLMSEPNSPWKVKLYTNNGLPPPIEESYKFRFFKFKDNYVVVSTYGNSSVRERYLKASVNGDYLSFIGTSLSDKTVQVGFNFIDFNFKPKINFTGLNEQSWFYSYFNDPIDFEKNYNLDINFVKSVSGIKQNFLIYNPYQTKISNINTPSDLGGVFPVGSMNLDVMSMKNIKNPNYSYSKSPYNAELDLNFDHVCDSDPEAEFNNRKYRRIFTGTNQELGYEEPLFVFNSNNKSIKLKKDNTTYFHYPSSAPVIKVEKSGLIEAGAFPSTIPFFADKLFKKDAQYGKFTNWGNSSQFKNGQFLCCWLSGSNSNSIWMDRWYLPSEISKFQALTSTYDETLACGINKSVQNNKSFFDVPSILTFEPQVWYKYFHVGRDFVNYSVDKIINYNNQYLTLHYNDFILSSIEDKSGNNNDAEFINYDYELAKFRDEQNDTVAHLNGVDEYVFIKYSDEIKPIYDNTISIWAYSDNWREEKNGEIISNGISNYFNFKISNGLESPIYCLYGESTNQLLFFNNEHKAYKFTPLVNTDIQSNVQSVAIDYNFNVWALDSENKFLYKINYNGIIELKLTLPSGSYKDVVIDSNNNAYVYDYQNSKVLSYDTNGNLIQENTSLYGSSNYTIQIDLDNNVYMGPGHKIIIDSKNFPWTLPLHRTNILRGEVPVFNLGTCQCVEDFTVNSKDNFYVLYDNNKVFKLDEVGLIVLSAVLPIETESNNFGSIVIQNDYFEKTKKEEDFVIVYKDRKAFKFDSNLILLKTFNLNAASYEQSYKSFLSDWSGYDFRRKFIYLTQFNGAKNLQASFTIFSTVDGVKDYYTSISSTRLDKGWHHFAFCFESGSTGNINFYVDGVLHGKITNIPNSPEMYVAFKNDMLLGAKMGRIGSFSDEVLFKSKYFFKGKLDDFRIYNRKLSELEIKLLFYTKAQFNDMDWNIPTGNQYYIEHVHKFFKNKMPGSKSNHYNIRIFGFSSEDENLRKEIEKVIKNTVRKISPVYTQLNEIKWND